MKSQHTPGPWKVERLDYPDLRIIKKSEDVSFEIIGPEDHGIIPLVCQTIMREVKSEGQLIEVDEANARLIAAAPEMFVALKSLLEYPYNAKPGDEISKAVWAAEQAIAKAERG